jgi:hypothetical protein
MKDKLITIALFIMAAFFIAAYFITAYGDAFEKVQDGVVTKLKQTENY